MWKSALCVCLATTVLAACAQTGPDRPTQSSPTEPAALPGSSGSTGSQPASEAGITAMVDAGKAQTRAQADLTVPPVMPLVETDAAAATGDAADDAAIWFNDRNPAQSLILATDKRTGLVVYGLDGRQRQFLASGRVNNVDLRVIDDVPVALASNRSDATLTAFMIDPETLQVREAGRIPTGMAEPYGLCVHLDPETGGLFAFVPDKTGLVAAFSVGFTTIDRTMISGERVFEHKVPSQAEGCVADDRTGLLYVGEENGGIWRFEALSELRRADDPDRLVTPPVLTATTGSLNGPESGKDTGLVADVEGLTLIPGEGAADGILIASSQGDSTFALFDLETMALLARFRVGPNEAAGIDPVTGTDGIDAMAADFGGAFSSGLFIVQDDINETPNDGAPDRQNFKLVPLNAVLTLLP